MRKRECSGGAAILRAMDLGLQGKVALVTAASEGIGKHCALALAEEGAHVAICARRAALLKAARAEIDAAGAGTTIAEVADLTEAAAAEQVVERTVEALGGLDILVNNMGGSVSGDEDAVWSEMFELNLLSTVRATRAAIPHMTARGGGSIIHIGSVFGREAGGRPPYNTMKAAVHAHATAMALAHARDNIRVNAVAPGSIAWPGSKWQRRYEDDPTTIQREVLDTIAFGRFGRPEQVAAVVTFLASEKAGWVTGACLNVDGGQSRSII